MPLARHQRAIATGAQHFGNGDTIIAQVALIGARATVLHHVADAGLVGVETGQQRGAGGAAARAIVHLRAADAVTLHVIEIGRLNFGAIAADVGITHVIDQDDDDVG